MFVKQADEFHKFDDVWAQQVMGGAGGFETNLAALKRIEHNERLADFETNLLDLPETGEEAPYGVSCLPVFSFPPLPTLVPLSAMPRTDLLMSTHRSPDASNSSTSSSVQSSGPGTTQPTSPPSETPSTTQTGLLHRDSSNVPLGFWRERPRC